MKRTFETSLHDILVYKWFLTWIVILANLAFSILVKENLVVMALAGVIEKAVKVGWSLKNAFCEEKNWLRKK